MNCQDAESLIDLDLLGDLHGLRRGRLRSHLLECKTCYRKLREARTSHGILDDYFDHLRPRRSLKDRVLAEIEHESPPRSREARPRWSKRTLLLGLAATGALAASLFLAFVVVTSRLQEKMLARIARVEGEVRFLELSDGRWRTAQEGIRLRSGQEVSSPAGGSVLLTLESGSRARLTGEGSLKLEEEPGGGEALVLGGGEVRIAGADEEDALRVETELGSVRVTEGPATFSVAVPRSDDSREEGIPDGASMLIEIRRGSLLLFSAPEEEEHPLRGPVLARVTEREGFEILGERAGDLALVDHPEADPEPEPADPSARPDPDRGSIEREPVEESAPESGASSKGELARLAEAVHRFEEMKESRSITEEEVLLTGAKIVFLRRSLGIRSTEPPSPGIVPSRGFSMLHEVLGAALVDQVESGVNAQRFQERIKFLSLDSPEAPALAFVKDDRADRFLQERVRQGWDGERLRALVALRILRAPRIDDPMQDEWAVVLHGAKDELFFGSRGLDIALLATLDCPRAEGLIRDLFRGKDGPDQIREEESPFLASRLRSGEDWVGQLIGADLIHRQGRPGKRSPFAGLSMSLRDKLVKAKPGNAWEQRHLRRMAWILGASERAGGSRPKKEETAPSLLPYVLGGHCKVGKYPVRSMFFSQLVRKGYLPEDARGRAEVFVDFLFMNHTPRRSGLTVDDREQSVLNLLDDLKKALRRSEGGDRGLGGFDATWDAVREAVTSPTFLWRNRHWLRLFVNDPE